MGVHAGPNVKQAVERMQVGLFQRLDAGGIEERRSIDAEEIHLHAIT